MSSDDLFHDAPPPFLLTVVQAAERGRAATAPFASEGGWWEFQGGSALERVLYVDGAGGWRPHESGLRIEVTIDGRRGAPPFNLRPAQVRVRAWLTSSMDTPVFELTVRPTHPAQTWVQGVQLALDAVYHFAAAHIDAA